MIVANVKQSYYYLKDSSAPLLFKLKLYSKGEKKELVTALESMEATVEGMTNTTYNYMHHHNRAFAQFAAIINKYKEITGENALIIVDHKQKNLLVKYGESQVEYFGKRGMSLLGAMMIWQESRYDKKDNKTKNVLVKVCFDMIFQAFSSQNNLQVLYGIKLLLKYITLYYSQIKRPHCSLIMHPHLLATIAYPFSIIII